MSNLEFYITLMLIPIVCVINLYATYVVLFVTPRVIEYNRFRSGGGFQWKLYQTNIFMVAFHPPKFMKKTKYYKESLQHFSAEPRDIFLYEIYRFSIITLICIILSILSYVYIFKRL